MTVEFCVDLYAFFFINYNEFDLLPIFIILRRKDWDF